MTVTEMGNQYEPSRFDTPTGEQPTLSELREALTHARNSHKRAILQGNPTAVVKAAQYQYHLQRQYEQAMTDADDYRSHMPDVLDVDDHRYGMHVVTTGSIRQASNINDTYA